MIGDMLISEFVYKFILTVVGVALFSVIDKARGIVTLASCICGAAAFTVSELLIPIYGNGFIMYLVSALVTCFLGELGARCMRVPVTVIILPAIIPLVPGSLLYSTMKVLINGEIESFKEYGREALLATAGIGLAIVSVSGIARLLLGLGEKFKIKDILAALRKER